MQAKDLRSKKLRCGASSPRLRGADDGSTRRRREGRSDGRTPIIFRLRPNAPAATQPPLSFDFFFFFSATFRTVGPGFRVPGLRRAPSLATLLCVLGVCVRSAPARPDQRRRPCVTRSAERSVHVAAGHEPVNVHRGTNSTFGSLRSCEREQLPCEARRSLPAHCAACARVRGALHSLPDCEACEREQLHFLPDSPPFKLGELGLERRDLRVF